MSNTPPESKGSTEHAAGGGNGKASTDSSGDTSLNSSNSDSSSESAAAQSGQSSAGARRRRRGSRGGRGRSTAARAARAAALAAQNDGAEHETDGSSLTPAVAEAEQTPTPKPKPRRSPSRVANESQPEQASENAKVLSKPKIGDTRPAPVEGPTGEAAVPAAAGESATDSTDSAGESPSSPKRRRRGGRRRNAAKRQSEAATPEAEIVELDEETLEKRKGKERKGRPVGRYLMCVQVRDHATQIAVLEGRSLIEHYVSRPNDDISQIDGNIYLSRVQNVLPGMEAAFIDIGTPKNAVLYRGDVRYDADDIVEGAAKPDNARIEQMIKPGQIITCQVTKNPIGTKGARLTQEVSLPGRFVVLMPNSTTYGISKRLPDDERKRLRKVLDEVKPAHHGIIVRTAAEGVTADELRRDVQRLLRQWDDIERLASRSQAPELLYREPDMAVRMIREEFNKNYRGVIIDDERAYEEVREYVASISPELADRIEYYDRSDENLPLFEKYHVHEQLHKALDRKVWLPSGGSLIIERTEALTVIDVNTGKNVGKSNLEETVFRNNLEAAEEIAHQLRLRDIGGIIVIDFIDMEVKANRDSVLNKLREALARDKTRTQAYPIGELGLVEMTRKRISEGLVESFSEVCPTCTGRGFVLDEALLSDD